MATVFTACQPEQVSTEPVDQNTINVTLDSWQHVEKTQPKLAHNIKQLKQQTQLNRSSSNYNFYINDRTVQVIEQPNYTTFTFFVYRDALTPNILENYTYKLYNDGTYEQFLLKYYYTLDQDLNKVFSETQFEVEAIHDNSLLYGRTNSCVPEFETVQTGVVCTVAVKCTGGKEHEAGHPDCVCETNPMCEPGGSMQCNPTYTVVYNNNCGGGGGDEPEPDPNQNTNTTNGGNTQDPNSDPDPNNNNTIATPLEDPTPVWQGILDCINNPNLLNPDTTTIDSNIFESLGLSKASYQNIKNYLDDNDCSEEAQEVVIDELLNLYDEFQIVNELNGKALCVYNKLKNLSNGFKKAIRKFEPEFPVAHLKFEADATMSSNTKKAYTRAPENYVIDIVLNGNPAKDASYQKRPNLLVAKTIIHEVIHAEMFRKLLSLTNNNGSIDVSLVNQMLQQGDYPGMLDYYFRNGGDINSNWQHQQMAAHYRETIARILQEYDTGISVPDDQQPQQLYLDLSWEGLIYSNITAWQEIMDDTERTRIENAISNYINDNLNQTCTE